MQEQQSARQREQTPALSANAQLLPAAVVGRQDGATIYLSWGGDVYGPSKRDEVIAGIRTSWFAEDTLYWHEGLEEWQPLCKFPLAQERSTGSGRLRIEPIRSVSAPPPPRRSRASKPSPSRLGRGGRAIFFAIALLAVLLTIGILLLLMQV